MATFISHSLGLHRTVSLRRSLAVDAAARARVHLRLAPPAAIIQPGQTTATAAPWRISTGTAGAPAAPDSDLTTFYAASNTTGFGFMGGGSLMASFFGLAVRRFPAITLADSGTSGNLQNGTEAAVWTVAFQTNSPRVAFRVDGSWTALSTRYRVFVDGAQVVLADPAPGGGGRRWLVVEPGAGTHVIMLQGLGDSFWGGVGVVPGAAVAPVVPNARAFVLGDSLTTAGGAGQLQWEGWPRQLAETFGIDDLWQSGSGGTGYINTASGTKKSFPQRAAQDFQRFADAGPAHLAILAGGFNDLPLGDVSAGVLDTIDAIRAIAPGVAIMVMPPYDTAAPAAPTANYTARRAEIIAAAAARPGVDVIDMQGLAYARSDGTHATQAGAATIAAHVGLGLLRGLQS